MTPANNRINVGRGRVHESLEREVFPGLGANRIYDHPAHSWKCTTAEKLQGGCPFHDSNSGTSFVVDRITLSWWCAGCLEGGGPIQ